MFFLTFSAFGSWAGVAVLNLLGTFVVVFWVGVMVPGEGAGLDAVV